MIDRIVVGKVTFVTCRRLSDTKGLPSGSPPDAEFTYLAPNVILAEKVRCFQVRSFPVLTRLISWPGGIHLPAFTDYFTWLCQA